VVSFRQYCEKQIPSSIISLGTREMFFMKSDTLFHWILFKTYMSQFQVRYKLFYRQMLAQLHINKEMCILHNRFHYFVHPLYIQKKEQIQLYGELNL